MYILFEEHQYESSLVERILKDIYVLQDVDKRVSVQYVGYFYNPHLHDCVFILPKVLLTEQETLVGVKQESGEPVTPEMVLEPKGQEKLSKEYWKFIYEFSVWIYRALNVFYKANPKSKAILYKHLPQAGKGRRHQAKTYLDIVLSLINFNQENKDFVLFTIKNLHRGNNKINWTRTIGHSQAFVQGEDVVYLNPVNKKRIINYEEELFVIFYSILNYLNSEYGFHTPINIQYDLITGKQFKQYLRGMGKMRLMQIKYKYFSDKALQLWDLCYAFFENSYRIAINTNAQEYLLAKSFNIVFEAMIDELIGTPHHDIPQGLADQDDGKRVDHMYTDLALTSAETRTSREVYYIGDSKYYKSGHPLTSESIYKQYTYARNVIQWNINLFLSDDTAYDERDKQTRQADRNGRFGDIRLQDVSITEGYDVIPNFFISAFVNDDLKYNVQENIRPHKDKNEEHCTKVSYQFPDRLFDRDTLFLSQYDVNFLYVLFLYARNKANEKSQWKEYVRKKFRDEIRAVIQKEFMIYAMRARLGVDGSLFLQQHFYELNGRVFQPYGEERMTYFAYARPTKNLEKTQAQYDELSRYFVIEKCGMGQDPEDVLKRAIEQELQHPVAHSQWLTLHYLERYAEKGILVGYYKDEEHLKWILGHNDKGSLVYNVRLQVKGEEPRAGAHSAGFYSKKNVQFVVLYTNDVEQTGEYCVFHVKDTASKVTEERMRGTWYPFDVKGPHFFFRFDEEVTIGKLRIRELLAFLRKKHLEEFGSYVEGEPLFVNAEKVLEYREGF
ncbi:MAG: restriction endonuclease [Bacteroidaceae bacterium]|nr:restriction endonuclease [Bacteroidaceae bacterium]